MNDEKKGIFHYYTLPMMLTCATQILAVNILLFDSNISLFHGIVLLFIGAVCLFLQIKLRSTLSAQANVLSATELAIAVMLKRQDKLNDALYEQLVRKHFDPQTFEIFKQSKLEIDKVAINKRFGTYDDIFNFYAANMTLFHKAHTSR